MSPSCPLCGNIRTVPAGTAADHVSGERFGLRRCSVCEFVFTWPRPADLERYYPAFYRRYGRRSAGLLQRLQQRRARRWIRERAAPGRCLEIGCGDGWVLAAIRDRGWTVVGLERSPESARPAREIHRLPVAVGPLEAIREAGTFDLIVLHHVLEHLPDPLAVLRACAKRLAPGGRLILAVPNFASWQRRFAGPYWVHLDVPRHLGHFTPHSLAEALRRAGLQPVREGFVSWEYDPFGWIEAVLNRLRFPLNTALRLLQRDPRLPATSPTALLALALGALLLPFAVALAVASWPARRGAAMEVWAVAAPEDAQAPSPPSARG